MCQKGPPTTRNPRWENTKLLVSYTAGNIRSRLNKMGHLGEKLAHFNIAIRKLWLRARAHLAYAFAFELISFEVCRYFQSLGVSSTIENNGSCQSIYRISDYTRSLAKDETPTRL